ncbi:MAG: metallophosphoesterase [Deltaproteobacteria bacterium]|jgi:predicted MPP superfamily phosphohydrolase|nr:metallophosphoesterase [Deltaproteobacteria bacterium]
MFLYFALILTSYVFASYVLRLPLGRLPRAGLLVLVFLSSGRLLIMRSVFGGLGGIEANRWLLLATSFLQGLIVMLFLLSLARDLAWVLSFLAGKGLGRAARVWLGGPAAAIVVLALAAGLDLAGLIGAARVPGVRRAEVVVNDWPRGLDGLKVAVLADMHISRFFDRGWVEEVVARTMAEKPDLILVPGDLVDGTAEARGPDVAPLASLGAPYGVWACVGNHEYISRLNEWLPVFDRLGIAVLYNAHRVIMPRGIPVILAGLADLSALSPRYGLEGPDLGLALAGAPADLPVILMEHRPVRARENALDPRVALQVSGHTHGGMMPILASFVKKSNGGFLSGFYDVGGMKLFVQPGLGLWSGFPVRLFVPSEITVLTIRTGETAALGQDVARG